MLNLILAALITVAGHTHTQKPDTTSCVQSTGIVKKIQDTGLPYIRIDDKGTLQALRGGGYNFEVQTVLVITVELPEDKTLILEFDQKGCMLPSGAVSTKDWHQLLERSQA